MAEPLIPGGYILLSRKIIESEIFKKPPLYLKVWIYLLSKAQHKDYRQLKRGQLWTNIPEIQEACSWYVGFRKETPSKKQIYTILEWLRNPYEQDNEKNTKKTMIVTTKGTQGMLIYIENFNHYQTSKNYEGNDEGNNEIPMKELRKDDEGNNINNNDNNVNNVNKEDVPLKKEKIYTKEDKEYLLAEYLSKQIAKRLNKPLKEEKDLQRWAADFNKMVRLDNYDLEEIKEVLMFSQKNDFWQTNILSAAKFRKQYLTLLSQMKRDEGKGKPDAVKKTNKFHNFIQSDMEEGDLEAMARKRFEEKIKKLGIATEEEK